MSIGDRAIRQVVVASGETPVLDAAKLMRQYHVGDIVVTDEIDGKRRPVGIVTDRGHCAGGVGPGSRCHKDFCWRHHVRRSANGQGA